MTNEPDNPSFASNSNLTMNSSPHSNHLPEKEFRFIRDNTKLISIDLIFINPDGAILKGLRKNKPAQGKWFVPGGRIHKKDTIISALHRIVRAEILGIEDSVREVELPSLNGVFSGPYDHIYPEDNIEYVVFGYYMNVSQDFISLQTLPKEQHSQWSWVKEGSSEFNIHEYSRNYFKLSKDVLFSDMTYDILNRRRDSFNQLLWATPSVSLVAQSFLFSVILGSNISSFSRLLASSLSIVISVASFQLLLKHRYNEVEIAKELELLEEFSNRRSINSRRIPKDWLVSQSSFKIWFLMISLFGAAAFFVAIVEILNSDLLSS